MSSPDERVLDVACGGRQRGHRGGPPQFATAVGLDYVPALLERGRERAAAEGLDVEFVEGDAQELPFEDASFDVVLSTFGAMFAPDQEKTAAELLRVCRSGGQDRDGELDPGRARRRGIVQVIAEARAAARRASTRRALGHRGAAPGAVRRRCRRSSAQEPSPSTSGTARPSTGWSSSGTSSAR